MVQIAGKYLLVENKNFYEFLLGVGLPADKAEEGHKAKATLDIKVDGDKITVADDVPPTVVTVILGKEVDEKTFGAGMVLKSAATLNGNILTISSKTQEGYPAGSRIFTFTDNGVEMTINAPKDGKIQTATRIFKRIAAY